MKGGKIVRIIGGKSVKRAKESITLTATEGDLTFNARQVNMIGRNGGVQYLNDYRPPLPLQVAQIEGPLDEQGEQVSVVEKGKSYKFRIVRFTREIKMPSEPRQVCWALQCDEGTIQQVTGVKGKQEVTVDISGNESSGKITIYAYISTPEEEGKAEAVLKAKAGGIHTRFYDEQGQQIYEIPPKLHKAFNEEYGIKIAYDKENEMLYHEGDCDPAYEKVSPTAIEHWKRELNPETISKGKLLFGYNFGYEAYSESKDKDGNTYDKNENLLKDFHIKQKNIDKGTVPGYRKVIKNYQYKDGSIGNKIWDMIGNIACIDLGDFNDYLVDKGVSYNLNIEKERYQVFKLKPPEFTNRYSGLPRVLEHEFIGHVIMKLTDDPYEWNSVQKNTLGPNPVEGELGNVIRRELDLPDRLNYTRGYKMNSKDDDASNIRFGYMNGNNRIPHPDADYEGVDRNSDFAFFGPPPKYPTLEGEAIIKEKDYIILEKVNYVIKIEFDGANETFNFS
ncbi:hypothetical protein O2K51_07275 [Apibacter raozihei]|uniref:hypothetical protein n=1 Tax=Apibacter raozihei TaxID=2500547 RepID=UPI000FE36048|nr:hypothetical protein [Apibacter raozihei]